MCFIKTSLNSPRGFARVRTTAAVALVILAGMTLTGLYILSLRHMAFSYTYAVLDAQNRHAMDQLTREIRQATPVLSYSTNSITVGSGNDGEAAGPAVTYYFDPRARKLLRTPADGTWPVLTNNSSLPDREGFIRCPSNSVFGSLPVMVNDWSNAVKSLKLKWKNSIAPPSCIPYQYYRYYDYSPKRNAPENMPVIVLSGSELVGS